MKKLFPIFFGLIVTFAASWLGVVVYSVLVLGRLEPHLDEATGDVFPPTVPGLATAGQRVYAANGCVSCHTQQVRANSTDVANWEEFRGIKVRPTVARDYVRAQPAFVGSIRIGDDLANAGLLSDDPNWYHRHLYEPRTLIRGSNMPSYRGLYRMRKISGQPSAEAVSGLMGPHAPRSGYEVVPTEDAKALVVYLMSLKRNYPLPEAEPLK